MDPAIDRPSEELVQARDDLAAAVRGVKRGMDATTAEMHESLISFARAARRRTLSPQELVVELKRYLQPAREHLDRASYDILHDRALTIALDAYYSDGLFSGRQRDLRA
ncbi:MAG TPA: hypothetical protein VJ803_04005 [Gemmatimonadaceae bacterium]|nr:hypothetical protein [Gemmatimonadaceae bacterium]